ncbi:NAD-dependent epimerase/dehydratase family protein [Halalkalibacter krulwichiae]|uniref:NAD-dependent epimerase/dehydratase domain-containing protein n=1 Tax=Halalkalibacter krulwichiae TaxID=199441 RepID=A0A1X9M807_9BACI|nr:NAD-dependent epimerase/dehydratase family protein [Halalkalibacter krulwichiae]ARK29575.1 hypothetical protein BkAM31D_06705 [Halalkalibacter krulwichiae]
MDKTALLIGATGLIGSHLLQILLAEPTYKKIIVFTRKSIQTTHPKLEEHVLDFDRLEDHFRTINIPIDDVFSCLGTTIKKARTKETMRKIDVDYPLKVAKWTKQLGANHFLLVSALNANAQSKIFYSKIKGELEEKVTRIGFQTVSIFRPSLLLGSRTEFRLGEKAGAMMYSLLPFLFIGSLKKYKAIAGETVALAMCKTANNPQKGIFVIPSHKIEERAKR